MVRQISMKEVRAHFGKFLDDIQEKPVIITKNGHPVALAMSVQNYKNYEYQKAHEEAHLAARAEKKSKKSKKISRSDHGSINSHIGISRM